MHIRIRIACGVLLALTCALVLGACGGSSGSSIISVLQGTAPDSLDPSVGHSAQASESSWLVYLGLYTYTHAEGSVGTVVIPAIAAAQPTVSAGGKTYSMTIRPGLTYSNGEAVKASDFPFAIERALKLHWGGASYFTDHIAGAKAFADGSAHKISGISANDSSGAITIHLLAAYQPFGNVLAFPAAGLLPADTPMQNESTSPPAGFGPYEIRNVVGSSSYSVDINPSYARQAVPGVPAAHANIAVRIEPNANTEVNDVLGGSADVFDSADAIPAKLASSVSSNASRYTKEPTGPTLFYFLNTRVKPFDTQLAREAVEVALDRTALSALGGGSITPSCYLLPPAVIGHPTGRCPYGDPAVPGNLAVAQALVKRSGTTGTRVTVWGPRQNPRYAYVVAYTGLLKALGYKATAKFIPDASYMTTIGGMPNNAQTGFGWHQPAFPNPADYYTLLDANSIKPAGNLNLSAVIDQRIQKALAKLNTFSTDQLQRVAPYWQLLDLYSTVQAFLGVIGYQDQPKFTSGRIAFSSLVFSPVYGDDWSSLQLK